MAIKSAHTAVLAALLCSHFAPRIFAQSGDSPAPYEDPLLTPHLSVFYRYVSPPVIAAYSHPEETQTLDRPWNFIGLQNEYPLSHHWTSGFALLAAVDTSSHELSYINGSLAAQLDFFLKRRLPLAFTDNRLALYQSSSLGLLTHIGDPLLPYTREPGPQGEVGTKLPNTHSAGGVASLHLGADYYFTQRLGVSSEVGCQWGFLSHSFLKLPSGQIPQSEAYDRPGSRFTYDFHAWSTSIGLHYDL